MQFCGQWHMILTWTYLCLWVTGHTGQRKPPRHQRGQWTAANEQRSTGRTQHAAKWQNLPPAEWHLSHPRNEETWSHTTIIPTSGKQESSKCADKCPRLFSPHEGFHGAEWQTWWGSQPARRVSSDRQHPTIYPKHELLPIVVHMRPTELLSKQIRI